jgi:hypothetical protein
MMRIVIGIELGVFMWKNRAETARLPRPDMNVELPDERSCCKQSSGLVKRSIR